MTWVDSSKLRLHTYYSPARIRVCKSDSSPGARFRRKKIVTKIVTRIVTKIVLMKNRSKSYTKKIMTSVVDTYLLFKIDLHYKSGHNFTKIFLRNRAPGSSLKSTQPANLLDPIDLPSIWMAEWGHSWARDHAVSMFQTHAHPGCPSSISDLMEKVGA